MAVHTYTANMGTCNAFMLALYIRENGNGVKGTAWSEHPSGFYTQVMNFYQATNFREFFESNLFYYEEYTRRFRNELISQIGWEWFAQYGVNPGNARIYSTVSQSWWSLHGIIDGVSCVLIDRGGLEIGSIVAIVHEFAHRFDQIGGIWYDTNAEFRGWCIEAMNYDTVSSAYNTRAVAHEYVVRAYTVIYFEDTGNKTESDFWRRQEKEERGFVHIDEVIEMLREHDARSLSVH